MFTEFDKVVTCLAAQVPESVHDDVSLKYKKLRESTLKIVKSLQDLVKAIDRHNSDPSYPHTQWVKECIELSDARKVLESLDI